MKKGMTYEFVEHFKHIPVYCTIVGISDFKLHWHQDYEIIMLLKGKLCLVMNDEEYLMEPGDVILINSNTPHMFQDMGEENLVLLLQFSPDLVSLDDERQPLVKFKCNSKESDITFDKAFQELRKSLCCMGLETVIRRSGYRYMIQSKIFDIIARLFRDFQYEVFHDETSQSMSPNNMERAKKILRYIDEHLTEDVSLSAVAKALYMSKSTLSHFFKDVMGVSFSYYVDTLRFNRSATMLVSTQQSILDVALDCGYNNDQAMYRTYQKRVNMTPSQYRKNMTQTQEKPVKTILGYRYVDKVSAVDYLEQFM